MDKHDILRVIARHLLKQRSHLERLAETSDWIESAKDAYDHVVTAQRTQELQEIDALVKTKAEDILWILEELGPGLAVEYLQFRAGSDQLGAHRPLYAACLKMGSPDLTWDDAKAQAGAASPLRLKNPQMPIFSTLQHAAEKAFATWKQSGADCQSLPYFSDRLYMNGIIRNLPKGDPLRYKDNDSISDSLRLSRMLLDSAISGWEKIQDQPHLVDEDLRLCALVTFACQELPGYSDFADGWDSDEANPVLDHLDTAIGSLERSSAFFNATTSCSAEKREAFAAFDASQMNDLRTLRERVEQYAHTELFTNPVTCAHRLYGHLEHEKLTELVTPTLMHTHAPVLKTLDPV